RGIATDLPGGGEGGALRRVEVLRGRWGRSRRTLRGDRRAARHDGRKPAGERASLAGTLPGIAPARGGGHARKPRECGRRAETPPRRGRLRCFFVTSGAKPTRKR